MSVKPIVIYPKEEAKLREKSVEIKKIDRKIQQLIQDLKDTLATQEGAGLAAVQIGVHKRVALICLGQEAGEMEPPRVMINPEILEEGPLTKGFDGCLSLPRVSTWDSLRPEWLSFRAQDENGEIYELRVEGADAAVVHHEIDHLDGVFFLDRLTEDAQLYIAIDTENGPKLMPLDRIPTSS